MSLSTLVIKQLRTLKAVDVSLSPEVNIILGANGSGKTSFLEAVFLLSRGSSFKTRSLSQLISFDSDQMIVRGQIIQTMDSLLPIAVSVSSKKTEIKLGGITAPPRVELSSAFPLQIIHPPSLNLLDSSPKYRRQFLDWGVFHVEHDFFHTWRTYARILKQRNAMLRSAKIDLSVWDTELSKYGVLVTGYRDEYITQLHPYFNKNISALLALDDCDFVFNPGWNNNQSLETCLVQDRDKDLRYKATQSGSHRDDFSITLHGRPVQQYLSRGNIKMLVFALQLAQIEFFADQKNSEVCLLLDNVLSELDRNNAHKMLECLVKTKMQKIITGFDLSSFSTISTEHRCMFHVEQGQISLK